MAADGLNFMSFDGTGYAAAGGGTPGPGFGGGPAFGAGPVSQQNVFSVGAGYGFEDEPPLLEELGIDLGSIMKKSSAVLHPRGSGAQALADGDMIGPVIFCLLLSASYLLSGKVLFGVVFGWSLVASISLAFIMKQLAPPDAPLGYGITASILGYSILPMVLASALSSVIPRGAVATLVIFVCVLWAARTASHLVTSVNPALKEQYILVLYPNILFYSIYAILALY